MVVMVVVVVEVMVVGVKMGNVKNQTRHEGGKAEEGTG
jgi:hypothetical protein